MHKIVLLLSLLALAGCTAMVVGGNNAGGSERSTSVVASDSSITAKIKARLAADDIVSIFVIGVSTYKGTVTLSGGVGSIVARDRAERIARETSGVKMVNNQIVLEDKSR
mgnify:CR=1 FL=1